MSDTSAPANTATGDKITRLTAMRGMIAGKMLESLSTSAQLTHHAECDTTGMAAMKSRLQTEGLKVSVEDLIIEAVVQSLRAHPALNGLLIDKEIHTKAAINIAVAIALPGDLLVAPAIFDAGSMDLRARVQARRELVERAKINKLTVKEMTGGTFTISNIGLTRVRHFTPILNIPQVAILGVGQTALRPWVIDGRIEPRPIMGLSLTFDHRAVNGAPAAEFVTTLCNTIEAMA